MIANLSKAIILYLAPLLALTSFLLNLFVFLAPSILFPDSVSLARVYPAILDVATNASVKAHGEIDGPTLLVGLLGKLEAFVILRLQLGLLRRQLRSGQRSECFLPCVDTQLEQVEFLGRSN